MTRIKVCGITTLEDGIEAARLGVDALGFVFYPRSPRAVTPEAVRNIRKRLPPFILCVGVFVNESRHTVLRVAEQCGLDGVQFHGSETPDYCSYFSRYRVFKAFSLRGPGDVQEILPYRGCVDGIVIDGYDPLCYGGTGKQANWELARDAGRFGPLVLAGGLNETNVQEALKIAEPYAVDISSGIEVRPGLKDHCKLSRFVEAVRGKDLSEPTMLFGTGSRKGGNHGISSDAR
jgi:phosphoribosylanthranilate isomerase